MSNTDIDMGGTVKFHDTDNGYVVDNSALRFIPREAWPHLQGSSWIYNDDYIDKDGYIVVNTTTGRLSKKGFKQSSHSFLYICGVGACHELTNRWPTMQRHVQFHKGKPYDHSLNDHAAPGDSKNLLDSERIKLYQDRARGFNQWRRHELIVDRFLWYQSKGWRVKVLRTYHEPTSPYPFLRAAALSGQRGPNTRYASTLATHPSPTA